MVTVQVLRQPGSPPARHCRYALDERRYHLATEDQVPEIAAECRRDHPDRAGRTDPEAMHEEPAQVGGATYFGGRDTASSAAEILSALAIATDAGLRGSIGSSS